MNKTAIKKFAVEARKKLMNEITYKAGLLGVHKDQTDEPVYKEARLERYNIGANQAYEIKGDQVKQRQSLVTRVREKGLDNVVEEVAYTWFNRLIAVRFMEINDYLPTRVRVLSSEKEGKNEPDLVTEALNVDLGYTDAERERIIDLKHSSKTEELFQMLFVKQCNVLNEILPDLFEKTSDHTELLLPISYVGEESIVRMLVDGIDEVDFDMSQSGQIEIIGWLYQYYNTELKDDTFAKLKSNVKITKERIPAATQLFTPDWIVRYMVENSLGRLWLENGTMLVDGGTPLKSQWKYYLEEAEQEPDVKAQLEKLRAENKIEDPKIIKIIDPCMGSGHILVYAFDVLMDIYKSCGYDERDAAKHILENNLYGLDIDDRAYQLAYFAVMMKARKYSRRILSEGIKPHLCAIQESNGHKGDFAISNKQLSMDNMVLETANYLIAAFRDAKEYGSILDIEAIDYDALEQYIERVSAHGGEDLFEMEYIGRIKEFMPALIKQAKIMSQKYDVVVTNPPYMSGSGMGVRLAEYVKENYPDSKADLFAVFIEKCDEMLKKNALKAMITQHSWMFLSSYESLRKNLLSNSIINMVHLGARAFEEIGGEVVQATAFVNRNRDINKYIGNYIRLVDIDNARAKEEIFLKRSNQHNAKKENFEKIPGMPIAYWVSEKVIEVYEKAKLLGDCAETRAGMITGNNDMFVRFWYEIEIIKFKADSKCREEAVKSKMKWFPYSKGGEFRKWYGNNENVVDWYNDGFRMRNHRDKRGKVPAHAFNLDYIFKENICWNSLSSYKFSSRYTEEGFLYDAAGSFASIKNIDIYYILGLFNSNIVFYYLSMLNPTLNFQKGNIASLPVIYDKDNLREIRKNTVECISISKTDWDSFETSWDFVTHPLIFHRFYNTGTSEPSKVGGIEYAYKNWEIQSRHRFNTLKANEEELNRIFIEIYKLQEELTLEVDTEDITVRKADLQRDIKSLISYAVGCMLGRYSLDTDGIAYAGGEWDSSKYKSFIPDADNIIPITDAEYFDDDFVSRFVNFVKVAYGEETLEDNLDFIADALGNKGNTSREKIRNYFSKDFYKDHIKTYRKKPIYWMFDSGKENGFKGLIYMHRYNQDTVAKVRTEYLHEMQKKLEHAIIARNADIDHATTPAQKVKAVKEKEKLEKQLKETRLYDAAIGHVAARRISIDLDDGVTVNYEKFQGVEVSNEGKKADKVDLLAKI
ncbi:MAG TPA: BREX-1 system adenine-specific DNA-methyltransferase PglX [Clostridiales bacterium]|nr:MAG: restriction endonuclease [Clostridiales bacterium GWD2_32_19]HCC06810.1 BREX-1 system adenine-specific DNA-methyltransferase PglX [Clostridiales bacterium]